MSKEPARLKQGRIFHKKMQNQWVNEASGCVRPEKRITKPNGRSGRIDIHVEEDGILAVVEFKASDWDRMKPAAVRRNVRRQIRQIWQYVESQLPESDVCPGVIFPHRPSDLELCSRIEGLFLEEGIVAVWEDETAEEMRLRQAGS